MLEVGNDSGDENKIERTVADNVIGDVEAAATGIADLGMHLVRSG